MLLYTVKKLPFGFPKNLLCFGCIIFLTTKTFVLAREIVWKKIDLDFDTNIRVKTDDADYSMVMSRISCPLKLKWDSVVYSSIL